MTLSPPPAPRVGPLKFIVSIADGETRLNLPPQQSGLSKRCKFNPRLRLRPRSRSRSQVTGVRSQEDLNHIDIVPLLTISSRMKAKNLFEERESPSGIFIVCNGRVQLSVGDIHKPRRLQLLDGTRFLMSIMPGKAATASQFCVERSDKDGPGMGQNRTRWQTLASNLFL